MTEPIILVGDARQIPLPDRSVQCVVTSPPYWGLRDYGTARWIGGDPTCDHRHKLGGEGLASAKQNTSAGTQTIQYRDRCRRCGAQRVDQQIGLEPTPDAYVETMVQVFREIRRVLRDDGTVWLNLGDSYAGSGKGAWTNKEGGQKEVYIPDPDSPQCLIPKVPHGLKHKDLVGIPWRVAFALQADGWYLRSDIIWAKPNPMPESVTDRPTKAHEYIFLLTKSERYYFDHEGSKEPSICAGEVRKNPGGRIAQMGLYGRTRMGFIGERRVTATRNARSVWTITTKPFKGAHFATFPPEIPERCIKAGTPEGGSCAACGTPFRRLIERGAPNLAHQRACGGDATGAYTGTATKDYASAGAQDASATKARILAGMVETRTVGWQPQCGCGAPPAPAVVFDPFAGAGTTLVVARALGRASIGLELNAEYAAMAQARLDGTPLAHPRDKQAGHSRRHAGFNDRYFGSTRP